MDETNHGTRTRRSRQPMSGTLMFFPNYITTNSEFALPMNNVSKQQSARKCYGMQGQAHKQAGKASADI